MISNSPLPAGVELTLAERFYRHISVWFSDEFQDTLWQGIQFVESFFIDYGILLLVVFVIGFFFLLFYGVLHRKQRQVEKIWNMILFFLSKRQMIIPLVFVFAKRENALSSNDLNALLDIREISQTTSFRNNPEERIKIEQEVSRILFDFFSQMEAHHASLSPVLQKLAHDFEFLDSKLVTLQELYNHEAYQWNIKRNRFFVRPFAFLFRFKVFQLFVS